MELDCFISQMADNARRICALAEGVSKEQAHWKPGADSWSILEVVNHLYDEERQDFRVRLDNILNKPDQPWPAIDPEGWVTARRYNEKDLQESVAKYLDERRKSLAWLAGLEDVNWEASCDVPWGQMRAGDMLASWVVHDLLHMRQLVELKWGYTVFRLLPYETGYAGAW